MRLLIMVLAMILATMAGAAALADEPKCASHEAVTEFLARQYGERPYAEAITAEGAGVRVYKSDEGTWTLVIIPPRASGHSCLLLAGEGWQELLGPAY